ncbi:MAG: uL15 family ribosomal protein, partial [bacterium]|nr:uL15 family ribosomal protein [bacterium]
VSLDKIAEVYSKGGEVSPQSLLDLKVIKKTKGRIPKIKILNGKADLVVKIIISNCLVSNSVKEKILKAGGEIK